MKTDYNIYVFDAAGHYLDPNDPNSPISGTQDDNIDTDEPAELVLFFAPGEYQLVIGKVNDGNARRIKYIDVNSARREPPSERPVDFRPSGRQGRPRCGRDVLRHHQFPRGLQLPRAGHDSVRRTGPSPSRAGHSARAANHGRRRSGHDILRGFDLEENGAPNFFGTSAAAPNVAGVAALVLQSMGGSEETSPDDIYDRLLRTATPVPLAEHRTLAASFAGAVVGAANGDYPGADNYWSIAVLPITRQTVQQVTIDLTKPDMFFVNPADADLGFKINATHGIDPSDVMVSRSADASSLTLTFAAGKFGSGDFLTFSNVAVPNALPLVSEVDADRVEGGTFTVMMSDGSTKSGTFFVDRKLRVNAFTGAGLVNADAATRRHHRR